MDRPPVLDYQSASNRPEAKVRRTSWILLILSIIPSGIAVIAMRIYVSALQAKAGRSVLIGLPSLATFHRVNTTFLSSVIGLHAILACVTLGLIAAGYRRIRYLLLLLLFALVCVAVFFAWFSFADEVDP